MNVLLPSEIARLVLGYLTSTKCTVSRAKFQEECPHLREYVYYLENGHEYPTNISGHDLVHYLNIGFQYTQYIICGDPLKYPLPSLSSFPAYFAYPPQTNRGGFTPGSTGQESPAQQGTRTATPMTSPRVLPAASRTPRWPNASPATADRRSPAESLIDVTTVTEPPSSEPQYPPPKRLSEAAIQTEDNNPTVENIPPPTTSMDQPNLALMAPPISNGANETFDFPTNYLPSSPKRKPSAPKKRQIMQPSDMILSPPTRENERKVIDQIVQSQLAERIAESINEVTVSWKPLPTIVDDTMTAAQLGANLPDSILSDVISKTLADPIMEELCEYVAIQSTAMDLDTPNGTPLKGMLLKTPFKQIGEEVDLISEIEEPPACQLQVEQSSVVRRSQSRSMAEDQLPKSVVSLIADHHRNESMKIVVNSSPAKSARKVPLRTLSAPRKPSPKVSPPESTTSTLLEAHPEAEATSSSVVNFSKNKIQPLPGTHIRALNFGFMDNALRYPHLHANMPAEPVVPVAPKVRVSRKRNSTADTAATPARKAKKTSTGTRRSCEKKSSPQATETMEQNDPIILSLPDTSSITTTTTHDEKEVTQTPSTSDRTERIVRRKAILVEAIPSSKKTAPRRVSASKPRQKNSIRTKQQVTVPTSNSAVVTDSNFIMPSTPRKVSDDSKKSRTSEKSTKISATAPRRGAKEDTPNQPLVTKMTQPSNDLLKFDISALLDKIHKPSALDDLSAMQNK